MVSLRSPQGLNRPFQVLPSSFPLAARSEAGHGTSGPSTKGRRRTPSRKSVRGFSVTHCSRHSLVRGLARGRSHWGWVRFKTSSQMESGLRMIASRDGLKCGITPAMLFTVGLWRTRTANVLCLCSSRIAHSAMALNQGECSRIWLPRLYIATVPRWMRWILTDAFTSFSLIALFELAGIDAFGCSQLVACVRRSQRTNEMELVRNLGWCGFNLTTLEPWTTGEDPGPSLSTRWLFLVAEV